MHIKQNAMTTTDYFKTILKILLVVLPLLFPNGIRAQHLQASLSHYTTENGMPSNTVSSLACDDYGYIWMGTWNGVSRFDGYNFYNYKTGIASGIRGLHNRIDKITIDQSQNVWLKMYDGKMFVINRQTDCIIDPLAGIGGHEEFVVDYFFDPYVTSSGDVLISYKDVGLYKLRLDRNGVKHQLITTSQLAVNCIIEGYHNDLWVGTNEGVRRIDMSNHTLERNGYFMDEHITRLATNGYNIFAGTKSGKIMTFAYGQEPKTIKVVGDEITGLYVDSHGTIWYSGMGDGTFRLNPETGDVKHFAQRIPQPEFTSRGAEYGESMGVVWIRMNHGGYGYYNREKDEVEYFHNDPVNPWNLSNTVNARLEMNDGVVWESTISRGLEKLEVLKNTITRTLLMPESDQPLDNEVRGMVHDPKRNVTLLANKRGKIFVYNKDMQIVDVITHDSKGNAISRPYGISMDSQGNYWVCDKDKGLFKITPTAGGYQAINICHNDNDPYSLSSNAAYQAVEDKQGNIWVATYGGGVNVVRKDSKSGRYIALHYKNVMGRYPHNAHRKVRTIALAKDGKVWAGSTDGILIMEIRNERITIEELQQPENMQDGLMSYDIVNLQADKQGNMWVGTNSGGLSRTDGFDDNGVRKFKNYGLEDGLPSEEIRSITIDEQDNIWFATDHLLGSLNTKKDIFSSFSNLDGVDETMCSESAAITTSDGKILFGTMYGFYTIDRKKLKTSTGSLLRLRITDFYLDDKLMSPRLDSTFQKYIPETMQVELPHSGSTIAFRFAALNYALQHRIQYQYMMEGLDDDWHNADKTRTATYEDLPYGEYMFKVKAFLLESPDAYDMRTVRVVIPPPFLLSTTAIWIYLGIIAILSIGCMLWYQNRLRRRQKQAEGTEDSKAENAVHDVANKQAETVKKPEPEQEVTDEYEIMEE